MKITSVRVNTELEKSKASPDGTELIAFVSITLDWKWLISHIRVVRSREGKLVVCMPSRITGSGHYRDVVYPIGENTREYLNETVLAALSDSIKPKNDPA